MLAEYFPRASPAGMAAGWAADLSALQGVRRTWHAGGALTFWDVEQAARSGAAVAALLFPPPLPAHNPPPPPSKQPAPALPPPQLLTAWGSL